ncbi:MAG: sugar kinase [SAR202 cluster bacterium]|nr:sugar kinase [SAR202 cluster bacterium]
MIKLVTFGETMVQYNARYTGPYRESTDYLMDCAGAESNVVVNIGKLNIPRTETTWISRLGDDEAGNLIQKELEGKTRVVAPCYEGENTGISYLNHHEDGEHVKTYFRKGSAASRLTFDEVQPHLMGCDLLHVTGITPALSETCRDTIFRTLHCTASTNTPVSFDLNYREPLWDSNDAKPIFEEMLSMSSIFKLGYDEAEMIWRRGWSAEQYARHFQNLNRGIVIITLGSDGALAFDGSTTVSDPGFIVNVVDPVGAGDAFVAGLLGGIVQNSKPRKFLDLDPIARVPYLRAALRIANVCGALACTRRGDTAAMPTMNGVEKFLSHNGILN